MSRPTITHPPTTIGALVELVHARNHVEAALDITKQLLARLENNENASQDRRVLAIERLRAAIGTLTLAAEDVIPDARDHLKHVAVFLQHPFIEAD